MRSIQVVAVFNTLVLFIAGEYSPSTNFHKEFFFKSHSLDKYLLYHYYVPGADTEQVRSWLQSGLGFCQASKQMQSGKAQARLRQLSG